MIRTLLLATMWTQAPAPAAKFGAFVEQIEVRSDLEWIALAPDGRPWIPTADETQAHILGVAFGAGGERFHTALEDDRMHVDRPGTEPSAWGGRGREVGRLRRPGGLGFDPRGAGRVLVADTLNHRVSSFATDGRALGAFGKLGAGEGELNHPLDVAVDAHGAVFVADAGNDRVVKFDAAGQFVKSFGGRGSYPGLFRHPTGLAVHGERVYVADRDNHRIQVFDLDGAFAYEWGVHALLPREGRGKLHDPSDVAVSPDGTRAAVLEPREDRIQVFGLAREETLLTSIERDSGVHFGGHPSVRCDLFAVCDPSGPSVSLFDLTTGTPIEITKFGRPGAGEGRMRRPVSVLLDARAERVYVADPYAYTLSSFRIDRRPDEVLRFDPFLARLERTTDLRAGSAVSLDWPIEPGGMALGAAGEVYLADQANQRVVVFDRELHAVRAIENGIAYPPLGVALCDGDRVLAVAGCGGTSVEREPVREFQYLSADGQLGLWQPRLVDGLTVFCGPRAGAVAFDPAKRLWTTRGPGALKFQGGLVPFDSPDKRGGTCAGPGIGRGQLWKPEGLAIDERGRVFVVDAGNHRFQVYAADGNYVDMFGARFYTEAARTPPPLARAPAAWDGARTARTLDGSWRIAWKARGGAIRRGEPFVIDAWVFEPGFPDAPARSVDLRLDAWMPEHLHGMTRVPRIVRRLDQGFTLEGVLLHMSGFWELDFDVTRGGVTSRASVRIDLE